MNHSRDYNRRQAWKLQRLRRAASGPNATQADRDRLLDFEEQSGPANVARLERRLAKEARRRDNPAHWRALAWRYAKLYSAVGAALDPFDRVMARNALDAFKTKHGRKAITRLRRMLADERTVRRNSHRNHILPRLKIY